MEVLLAISGATTAAIAAGIWWLSRGRRLSEAGERLRRHRRATIRDAPEGKEAKIVGTLCPVGEPLTAPLSGRECACWEVVIDERPAGSSEPWSPLLRRHDVQTFEIEDETGRARVEPRIWGVEVVSDFKQRIGTFSAPPKRLVEFLAEQGFMSTNRALRYREGVLERGERVAVLGPCRREPFDEESKGSTTYRDTPTRLVVGSEISGVTVSDDPRVMK